MPLWEIQRFSRSHDRTHFNCGIQSLNHWLKRLVSQHEKRDLSRTYVAILPPARRILGYYAIANHRVSYDSLSADQAKGLPRIDIPVVLLGRLAVDQAMQGQGLGEFLLLDAMRRVDHIAQQIGIRAIEVDAINESARAFYLKYGFEPLQDDHDHLFLPMQSIRMLDLPPF